MMVATENKTEKRDIGQQKKVISGRKNNITKA